MRIFLTGATGFLGRAIAEELRRKGHRVAGLARTAEKAKALAAREIEPVTGDMRDPKSWARAAESAEILVHAAAEYSAEYQALDRKTVDAFLALAKGPRRRKIVYTSGVWLYGACPQGVDESTALVESHWAPWRGEHEKLVLASGGLVIRPGCVYGGAGSLTGYWFHGAVESKAAPVIGDGSNRWAMVHLDDCADLYRRAAESALSGELFNATDRSRSTVLELATAASRAAGAGGAVKHLTAAEAEKAYGPMAQSMAFDQNVDSSKAVRLLGWNPRHGGFADDADRFFASWRASR